MIKEHIIIVAGGLSTRLVDVHNNLYPKLLINVGNDTVLDKIVENQHKDFEVYIIVQNQKQLEQLQQYVILKYGKHHRFVIIVSEGSVNNFHALQLSRYSIPSRAIITWSDIWLKNPQFEELSNNIVFTSNTNNRYNVNECKLEKVKSGGNVCGIFFTEQLHSILNDYLYYDEVEDFVEVFDHRLFTTIEVEVEDIGDMQKYNKLLSQTNIETRFFNSLEYNDDTLKKSAVNDKGVEVIKNEIDYYKFINSNTDARALFPTMYQANGTSFIMGKIDGFNLKNKLDEISQVIKELKKLHKIKPLPRINKTEQKVSLKLEYKYIPLERMKSIDALMPRIDFVNNTDVRGIETLALLHIDDLINDCNDFTLIHGDPNSSNVMIDKNGLVKFIDPRGVFGTTKLFGDPNYDFAKLIYGVTGYDKFNDTKDVRFIYNDGIITIDDELIPSYDEIVRHINKYHLNKNIDLLVALIWYKLPAYTINNINKAIVAKAIALLLFKECIYKRDII